VSDRFRRQDSCPIEGGFYRQFRTGPLAFEFARHLRATETDWRSVGPVARGGAGRDRTNSWNGECNLSTAEEGQTGFCAGIAWGGAPGRAAPGHIGLTEDNARGGTREILTTIRLSRFRCSRKFVAKIIAFSSRAFPGLHRLGLIRPLAGRQQGSSLRLGIPPGPLRWDLEPRRGRRDRFVAHGFFPTHVAADRLTGQGAYKTLPTSTRTCTLGVTVLDPLAVECLNDGEARLVIW